MMRKKRLFRTAGGKMMGLTTRGLRRLRVKLLKAVGQYPRRGGLVSMQKRRTVRRRITRKTRKVRGYGRRR